MIFILALCLLSFQRDRKPFDVLTIKIYLSFFWYVAVWKKRYMVNKIYPLFSFLQK
ncbi:hypothetical protein BAT_3796 [Bacillus pumilus ATCC 7061]|nr:hypothetical protein BAT_3796 [Bacillus pumilus ATCC 7061]